VGGWPETIEILLEAGADVDSRSADGRTPLMMAVPSSERFVWQRDARRREEPGWADPRLDVVKILLEAGADRQAEDTAESYARGSARDPGPPPARHAGPGRRAAGDLDLLDLGTYRGIRIETPRQWLE
jgi:hypothetical protein